MKGNKIGADAFTKVQWFDEDGNYVVFKMSNSVLNIWMVMG